MYTRGPHTRLKSGTNSNGVETPTNLNRELSTSVLVRQLPVNTITRKVAAPSIQSFAQS